MGRQLGPPCPTQKRRRLPIVCGVKSKRPAWNSSACEIGSRPAYQTLSAASTSCPARPSSFPAPESPGPHLRARGPALCPRLSAVSLLRFSRISSKATSSWKPPGFFRPSGSSLASPPTLPVGHFCIFMFQVAQWHRTRLPVQES